MNFRDQIEAGFERWGHIAFHYRWAIILIALSFSGALITQVPKIRLDMSTEGFLHPDDPILLVYNEFRDQFERDDRVLIAIQTDRVFDREFLAKLRDFHQALEGEVPQLDEVDSLINARNTRGEEDEQGSRAERDEETRFHYVLLHWVGTGDRNRAREGEARGGSRLRAAPEKRAPDALVARSLVDVSPRIVANVRQRDGAAGPSEP